MCAMVELRMAVKPRTYRRHGRENRGYNRPAIRIPQRRGRSLVRRFTLSATKRTARFMLCLLSLDRIGEGDPATRAYRWRKQATCFARRSVARAIFFAFFINLQCGRTAKAQGPLCPGWQCGSDPHLIGGV